MEAPPPYVDAAPQAMEGKKAASGLNFPHKYTDIWATLLFVAHLVLMIIIWVTGKGTQQLSANTGTNSNSNLDDLQGKLVRSLLAALGVSIVWVMVWLVLLKRYARQMITGALVLSALMSLLMIVVGLAMNLIMVTFSGAISLIFLAFVWWRYRQLIPLSSLLLSTSASLLQNYSSLTFVALGAVAVMIVYLLLWVFAAVANNGSSGANYFLMFSSYWTAQTIRGLVVASVAGVYGGWYFLAGTAAGMEAKPVSSSVRRACTYAFGPITMGALLVAIVQFINQLIRSAMEESNAFIRACAMCLLNMLERILELFTKYVTISVALWGEGFIPSAKSTLTLFKQSGFSVLINDSLVGMVLSFGAIIGGFLAAIIGALLMNGAVGGERIALFYVAMAAILSFFIGVGITTMVSSLLDAGVSTLFLCTATDPSILASTKPELYQKLKEAYPEAAAFAPGGRV